MKNITLMLISQKLITQVRSSRLVFLKVGILKNFEIFSGNTCLKASFE